MRLAVRGSVFMVLFLVFALSAHAGPVYQANAFSQAQFSSVFQVNLATYSSNGTGPLTEPNPPGGGAFKATIVSGGGTYNNLFFPTFCLESTEHFSPSTMYATIDPAAMMGGLSGATGGKDPVSSATQFLYKTFLTGQLDLNVTTFHYDNDQASYTALQNTIWALEGEVTGGPTSGLSGSTATLAQALYDWANANNGGNDYGVKALNLWSSSTVFDSTTAKQSQLIWTTPEPSSALLLGMSLLGLVAVARFRQRGLLNA